MIMTDKKLIHLVDDDEAIRHSASFMLRHAGFVVKTYKDGVSFLEKVADADHGCILLDVRMPVIDGLAVQRILMERGVDMPVIVLTGHGDVNVAVAAMKAGAVDFVQKPYEKAVLINAIETAFVRLEARTPEENLQKDAIARLASLTAREHEVLTGMVAGHTNKIIAAQLGISPRTVEIHRAHLMDKLNVTSLSAAMRLAFVAGL